jgi:hypothetical protein
MPSAFQFLDNWISRLFLTFSAIIFPGIAGIFLIDLNASIFQGEFGLTEITNFNTIVIYYVERLDLVGQQQMLYTVIMGLLVYILGYFLHSSSKFFASPKRFRQLFQVTAEDNAPHLEVPPSAQALLQVREGDLIAGAGVEVCQALVSSAGLLSRLPSLERKLSLYRSMGYLFSLMVIFDLAVFVVAFDFRDIIVKASVIIGNLTFAFLFFKGQEEVAHRWKETLAAETVVAAAHIRRKS